MPSKNSINKPKQGINKNKKSASLAKKRSARIRSGLVAPPRSSSLSTSGQPRSTAIALYNGEQVSTRLTTMTLSKKRAQKIERNKRYIEKRKLEEKILIDVTSKLEESMDVDVELPKKVKKASKIDQVKQALLSVVEDKTSDNFILQTGEGTTLGSQTF